MTYIIENPQKDFENESSSIVQFFEGKTIFVTGASGFLGKVLIEKLLRTCYNLNKIYITLRPKKGKEINQRLEEIFQSPMFERLKKERPKFIHKVGIIQGDCTLPNMGISIEDEEIMISEVDVVIHCAATTRFDEHIRKATNVNVVAIRDLLKIAEKMRKLKSFVHVSTAYSNAPRDEIDEIIYEPHISAHNLIKIVEAADDEALTAMTLIILKDHPNTYTLTKLVAEKLIDEKRSSLPIGIFRPSIVISAKDEPYPGWIDNMFGPIAASVGIAVGIVRCLPMKRECLCDIVPVDMVINSILAFAWDIGTKSRLNKGNKNVENIEHHSKENNPEEKLPICNYVSSTQSPLTSGEYADLAFKHFSKWPSVTCVWSAMLICARSMFQYKIYAFFLHVIPAYIVDFILLCIGKKPLLVNGYKKIDKFMNVYCFFTFKQWKFSNNNVQSLWKKLDKKDKELFDFTLENINWPLYFETIGLGGRLYLLKDPLETLERGRRRFYILKAVHYIVLTVVGYGFYKLVSSLIYFTISLLS